MKTKIIFSIILILLLIGTGIYYLLPVIKNNMRGNEVVLFIDKTDVQKEPIKVEDITPILGLDKSIWKHNKIRFQTLSNYEYTNVKEIELPYTFFLFSNPKKRKKEIIIFTANIDSTLKEIYKADSGKARSSIYEPLVRTANTLAQSKASKKVMIVESDLQENTNTFSIYRESDYIQLQKHPEQVAERLETLLPLNDVQGIDIYLIYQPKSDADNERFILMAHLFTRIFEAKGAHVHIGSNLVI